MDTFDELIQKQKETVEWIKKVSEKYTKEPKVRRTRNFIQERLDDLGFHWKDFQERHTAITEHTDYSKAHPYVQSKYIEQVEKTVLEIKNKLNIKMKELDEEEKRMIAAASQAQSRNDRYEPNEEQKKRIKRQEAQKQAFFRSLERMDQAGQVSKAYYSQKMAVISNLWEIITKTHNDIIEHADDDAYYAELLRDHEEIEQIYENIMVKLQENIDDLLKNDKSEPTSNNFPKQKELKLPTIKIPAFDGDYKKWKSFIDLFQQTIDKNENLGNVQKLHYLKTNLTGEAAKMIQHLQIIDTNYTMARDMLINRYENTRLLVNAQLQALLNQRDCPFESAEHLRRLHDTTAECVNALKGLTIDTGTWDPMVVFIVSQKLDNETRKAYEQSLSNPKDLQGLDEFLKFLENKFNALENLEGRKNKGENTKELKQPNYAQKSQYRKPMNRSYHAVATPCCRLCKGPHWLHVCNKFVTMPTTQRQEVVKREKLCRNCFKSEHNTAMCTSFKTCQICRGQHHTLLHAAEVGRNMQSQQSNFADTIQNTVLLATALIKTNWNGGEFVLRALVDQGSQSSFITEDAVQRLQLKKRKTFASVTGLGSTKAGTATSKVELQIKSIYPSTFQTWATFLVLPKLTKVQPDKSFIEKRWDHIEHLSLADPSYNKRAAIDVLIGADVFQDIIIDGVIKGNPGSPIAQNTKLGWILSGSINQTSNNESSTCHITNVELNDQLKLFWETEEIQEKTNLTMEELRCEEIFMDTHKREPSGRYVVRLPFKEGAAELGESKKRALARFLQTEKRFSRDKQLHEDYNAFLQEYIELGHMELVDTSISTRKNEVYYLPHQAVIRPESSTTKLRVVFDASSKTSSGLSLNDKMLTGPIIQNDLYSIITRWRKHKIVFRADIEKMYRQILVAQEDQDYQRILWREKPTQKIKEYRLKTVTYGTSSAPFLATRVLHQLALDEEEKFELASKLTREDFYVDDLLSGADTIKDAQKACTQLTQLMTSGGFKLRKWSANSETILKNIATEDQDQGRFKLNAYDPVKTLGIYWRPESDTFEFKTHLETANEKITKRIIVSETARLFDPLGWLTPIIIKAKIVQQELWKEEREWDEILPEEIISSWKKFKNELSCIENIKIPRWNQFERKHRVELHGFCDASERAFAAVIYTRVITEAGTVHVNVLCAKSKVAPIKKVSIPRLELCGAVLLAKLIKKTVVALSIDELEVHAWTDSKITLAWLNGNPFKWKNYVANRVETILKVIDSTKWHHVSGNENPADCASRGINPSQLKDHLLWWNGPKWLSHAEVLYNDNNIHSTDLEIKKVNICAMMSVQENKQDLIGQMTTRHSSLKRLTRILAYCERFLYNVKSHSQNRRSGPLSSDEIESANKLLIRNTQNTHFGSEMKGLKAGKDVEKKSKLRCLVPFIDEDGIIRVTGRLTEAKLSELQKHPIIIPHKSDLTTLLIDDAHKSTLHGGSQLTHSYIRQRYWVINGSSAVKQRLHGCTICFRHKSDRSKQLMGNLPQPRVNRSRPFLHTGVDYAGPIDIRMSKGRGNKSYKGYIAIFICLATKAIHIEVVSDLTANAFIAAFKRLCGRRGHVAHLYSDNGTNFVSANKILQLNVKAQEKYNQDMSNMLMSCSTEWHFIPPGAPHFGGLWEAGVKSIKYHLKRTIGEHKLTFEELATLLTQIEACLNSRPLYPLSNDPDDPDVLTAGHFLIGAALLAPPEKHRLDEKEALLTRWQLLERMQQQFWKKWSQSYLTTLQQRQKWTQKTRNLSPGNIVLLKDDNLPPTRWSLGIIEETHAGDDDLVRVVSVRTKNKIYKRPIGKLCPLPIIDNNNVEEINTEAANTVIELHSPNLAGQNVQVRT